MTEILNNKRGIVIFMNSKNKIQKLCKLKKVLDKTLITCFIEGKCNPEIVRYSNGTIIFRSQKQKI